VPRASRKKDTPDENAIYVAWQAASADIDGVPHSVVSGERRRGSDPLVQAHPWLFVPDGTPAAERPNAFSQVVARTEAERPPADPVDVFLVAQPEQLERVDTIALTRSLSVKWGQGGTRGNATYEKGALFSARSELAEKLPDDAYQAEPGVQFTKRKGRR
jgi:hypothetical protein